MSLLPPIQNRLPKSILLTLSEEEYKILWKYQRFIIAGKAILVLLPLALTIAKISFSYPLVYAVIYTCWMMTIVPFIYEHVCLDKEDYRYALYLIGAILGFTQGFLFGSVIEPLILVGTPYRIQWALYGLVLEFIFNMNLNNSPVYGYRCISVGFVLGYIADFYS
jgi:hypothetical protein